MGAMEDSTPRVDDFLPEWTDDHARLLDAWYQGALINGTSWAWACPPGVDPIAGEHSASAWEVASVVGTSADYSIVTSQTCDIAATGPGRKHPFVQVSPLVTLDHFNASAHRDIERWSVTYLVPVFGCPDGVERVADLRISMPVSKGLLLAQSPTSGFRTEYDRLRFAEHLAGRVRRPALHEALTEGVIQRLGELVKNPPKDASPEWHECVEQIRVELDGDRLQPQRAVLHFVCERPLGADEIARWREAQKPIKKLLAAHGIDFGGMRFHDVHGVLAEAWRAWIPIRVPGLIGTPYP